MVSASVVPPAMAAVQPMLGGVDHAATTWKKHSGGDKLSLPPSTLDLARLPPSPTRARCRRAPEAAPAPVSPPAPEPEYAGTPAAIEIVTAAESCGKKPPLSGPPASQEGEGFLSVLRFLLQAIPNFACADDRTSRKSSASTEHALREQAKGFWTEEASEHASRLAEGMVGGLQSSSSVVWLMEECRVRRAEALEGVLQVRHLLFEADWEMLCALEDDDSWNAEAVESAMVCYTCRLEWVIGMIVGLQRGLGELRRAEARNQFDFEGEYAVMVTLLNDCEDRVEQLAQDVNRIRSWSYE